VDLRLLTDGLGGQRRVGTVSYGGLPVVDPGDDVPALLAYIAAVAACATAFADLVDYIHGHTMPWSTRWAHAIPRTPHRVLGHHDGPATAITSLFLPDAGQVAVGGGADGVVQVWNLEPGGPIHEPRNIGTPVHSLRPLPRRDGQPGVLLLDQAGTCT
jgi:hypothetical protein